MASKNLLEHVRPRPVTRLPELAPANARRGTADQLVKHFGLSDAAARAIANAALDQKVLRASVASPERRRVPGGELIAVRADAWVRRVGPDPSNIRTNPNKVHPFAVAPGSGGEASRFAPIPRPRSEPSGRPELVSDIESRLHFEWAHARAAEYVLAVNDWRASIAAQGVMEEVWLTAVTYKHKDTSDNLVICQTSEGSSRTTACQANLDVEAAADLYDLSDAPLRAQIERFNRQIDLGTLTEDDEAKIRSFTIPALFVVGFDPVDPSDAPPFHVAVQSLVALLHVDPPEPWGEGSEMEALADGVLDELERRRVIKHDERRWLAGDMTRDEAERSHFSNDPAVRAAHIVGLFTSQAQKVQQAIRDAVTAQSTRRQIRNRLKDQMATALIMRALEDGGRHRERVRKYMNYGVGQEWHRRPWRPTHRSADDLEKAALEEADNLLEPTAEPGPASLEVAARAMYPLITGHLHADRGTANNKQPDRRNPGQVLDQMRRSPAGVRQLAQALRDGAEGKRVRAVDESGRLITDGDGSRVTVVREDDLRRRFPDPGKPTRTKGTADTPQKQLANALAALGEAVGGLNDAMKAVGEIRGHDGRRLAETEGVAPNHIIAWVRDLEGVRDELQRWRWAAERRGLSAHDDDGDGDAGDDVATSVADLESKDDHELSELAERNGIAVQDADREDLIDELAERLGLDEGAAVETALDEE